MLSETAKFCRTLLSLSSLTFLLLGSSSGLAQQSVEENVQPAGQVCLTGQACVGTTSASNTGSNVVQPAAVPAVVVESTPEPEPVVTAEVEPAVVESAVVESAVAAFDAAATYQMSCFACHGTGAAGAPVLGDQEAWSERMEKGIDSVMANVMNGLNAMPAKGLCFTCSDDDLLALVEYMASQ